MDVLQAVLDGIAIAAIFNGAVAALVLINPRPVFRRSTMKVPTF